MRQRQQNLVAKYCCRFNKPKVEENKVKTYKRKEKHCKRFVDHLIALVIELLSDLQIKKSLIPPDLLGYSSMVEQSVLIRFMGVRSSLPLPFLTINSISILL